MIGQALNEFPCASLDKQTRAAASTAAAHQVFQLQQEGDQLVVHCTGPVCPGAGVGGPDELKSTGSCVYKGGKKKGKKKKQGQTHSCLKKAVLGFLTPLAAVWDVSCLNFQRCTTKLK